MPKKLKPFVVIDGEFQVLSGCYTDAADAERAAKEEGFNNILEIVELDLETYGKQHLVRRMRR